MKKPRKPGSPYFGPRSSSRFKVTLVRKSRKHNSRFVSPIMKKIDEEVKKQNIMRTISAANQAFVLPQAKQSFPKIRNMVKSKGTTMNDHLGPSARNVSKLNQSLAMPSKVGDHSKYSPTMSAPSGKLDKATTSKSSHRVNGTSRPLELSHEPRMMQGSAHIPNSIKRSYSHANHLKAMPGLVHNKKVRSNLDHGASMGMRNEGGHGGPMSCEPLPELKITGAGMQIEGGIGGTKDKNMRREPSPEPEIPDDRIQSEGGTNDRNMRCEPLHIGNIARKRRKYIETNDEDDDSDCCSMPIDEPAWRGILKTGNEDISLAGHLSTKSGEKVWNLSKSLRRVVEVTKVCRSDVWPKRWEASGPTSDNIGLYFFSHEMSPDRRLDQLVKEAMENDLALRTAVDEAEMLMFPSSLLPEQYQTFQSKHYMWGVFRPRVVQGQHGDESRHLKNPTEEATAAVATNATTSLPAEASAVATNAGAVPAEAPVMPTTVPTNGRIDLSMGAPFGRVVSFVVRKTPRVDQLIQEIEREGALIVAMQGEMIAGDGSLGSQQDDRNAVSRSGAWAANLPCRHPDSA